MPPRFIRGSCSPAKEGEDTEEKPLSETIKRNNAKLLTIYETWKQRVKAWIKDSKNPGCSELKTGKKGGRLRSPWATRDTKIEEPEAENKKLKAQIKELKWSGGAVSTSTVGAHDEEVSVQLEQEGKKWKVEFERLAREKQEATLQRDDLQRRLSDAEADMARAQRPHEKELAQAAELSDQKVKCADLTGYARGIGGAHRPRGGFNTPSSNNQDDGSSQILMGAMPSQYPPPQLICQWPLSIGECRATRVCFFNISGSGCGRRGHPYKNNAGPAPRLWLLHRARWQHSGSGTRGMGYLMDASSFDQVTMIRVVGWWDTTTPTNQSPRISRNLFSM